MEKEGHHNCNHCVTYVGEMSGSVTVGDGVRDNDSCENVSNLMDLALNCSPL